MPGFMASARNRRRAPVYGPLVALVVVALCPWGAWAAPFRTVVDEPFATVADGPPGAIVVELDRVPGSADPRVRQRATWDAVWRQHNPARLAAAAKALRWLQRHRSPWAPRCEPMFPRTVVYQRRGKLAFEAGRTVRTADVGTGALGGGSLTLTFEANSFTGTGERTALTNVFNAALPRITALYDAPAENVTVQVEEVPGLTTIQGGLYIPGLPTGRLQLPPFDPEAPGGPSGDLPVLFVLVNLLVRAYHNTAFLWYDSWEEGFAQVVALDVMEQLYPLVDPAFYAAITPIPWYDSINAPPLAGQSFYPASGYQGMLAWRAAAATAVWGKCLAQDRLFFKKFNAAYYVAHTPTLPGDVPALRSLAAGVVPTIEGLDFNTWFHLHHVLDNSVHQGEQLYTFMSFFPEGDQSDEYTVALVFAHFYVNGSGDEQPLGGTATILYWDHDRTPPDIDAGTGANQATIPATGEDAGIGFASPTFFPQNVGNQGQEGNGGRIFFDVSLGGIKYTLLYPYTGPGAEALWGQPYDHDFYGVLTTADDGRVRVTPPAFTGLPPADLPVDEGEFHGQVTGGFAVPGPHKVEFFYPAGAGTPNVTRWVNVYGPQCAIVLDAANTVNSINVSLPVGLSLMSLPIWPLANGLLPADPADVLGVPQDRLLLARWEPSKAGTDKYTWYPKVRPFEPGLGYFLDLRAAIVGRTVYGTVPAPGSGFYANVEPGWNTIGFPYDSAGTIAVADLMVGRGSAAPVSWSQAVSNGWVEAGVFDFQEGRVPETDEVTELIRLKGYWVICLAGDAVQIYFPAPSPAAASSSANAAAAPRAVSAASWGGWWGQPAEFELPIFAKAGGRTSVARLATSQEATNGYDPAFDFHRPPAATDAPAVYSRRDAWGAGSGEFARDTLAAGGWSAKMWDLEVAAAHGGAPVELAWPDLSQLPAQARPVLIDRDAPWIRVNMRQRSSYTYVAGTPGEPRRFRVRISGASYVWTPSEITWAAGRGALAHVTLGDASRAKVVLRDAAGRTVSSVEPAGTLQPGDHMIPLPGTAALRPGSYLCEIRARGPDGPIGRTVRVLTVPRAGR